LELGLQPRLIYEKHRDTWKLRSVEVVLDELPFGMFMEIEGSITGIREAELLLDLDDVEVEHETYPMLTGRLGTKIGDMIEARFT
jgi:adenylate cyclase class 2